MSILRNVTIVFRADPPEEDAKFKLTVIHPAEVFLEGMRIDPGRLLSCKVDIQKGAPPVVTLQFIPDELTVLGDVLVEDDEPPKPRGGIDLCA